MHRIGDFLAEGAPYTLLGCTLIVGGAFLLWAWHMTRPEGGRTGVHRDGAQTEGKHRKEGSPGESTRVLRYDSAVARARVMGSVHGAETTEDRQEEAETEGNAASAPEKGEEALSDGWFYDFVRNRIVLFVEGRPERIIASEEYADRKGAIDKELFVARLPMIPDTIPYIEWRRRKAA